MLSTFTSGAAELFVSGFRSTASPRPTSDVIDELAVTRPKIKHDIVWFDVALKERAAENPPQFLFARSISFGESLVIQGPAGPFVAVRHRLLGPTRSGMERVTVMP